MWRNVLTAMLAIVCMVVFPAAAGAGQINITDAVGRSVSVPDNPQRIICLGSGCLRLIVYLGAADKVVGVEKFESSKPKGRPYRYACPELAKLPVVGPGGPKGINTFPDLEAVLTVRPEIIFVTFMDPENANKLQETLNIPVVLLSYGKFAAFDPAVFDSLDLAGRILGCADRAEKIRAFVEDQQADLAKRTASVSKEDGPTVYVGGCGFKGMQGFTSTDAPYTPLAWVAADNVAFRAEQKPGHVFTDKETVLRWNPDIVFIDGMGLKLVADDYAKDTAYFQALGAFKNGRVKMLFPFNWYVTNIGTIIVDAYAAGKALHPELFADVDPVAKADEVYGFFVGKPVYDLMAKDFGPLGGNPPFLKQ